jgi:hypothetical protein
MGPRCSRIALASVLPTRVARLLGCAILAFIALVAVPSAGRPSVTRFDALPRAAERLAQPIWLPHCRMQIIEWRSTTTLLAETAPGDQALAVIDDTCRDTFERYDDFLRAEHLPRLKAQLDKLPTVSLLPGNTLLDGKSLRALNDLPARFEAVAPGCCYWGLYVDALNHLFLRNDPLIRDDGGKLVTNPRFVRTFTHEIGHVLSSRLGVWDAIGYDRQRDEDLAEAFVAFMGMRFPAESSADDLAYHHSRASQDASPPVAESPAPTRGGATAPPSPSPSASANTSRQR